MGTEGAYEPYNFINDAGEVDGFERELCDELCSRADLECTWVTNDWDTIMAGMSITGERDEIIDFTQPYIPPIPSVYYRRSTSPWTASATTRSTARSTPRWPPYTPTTCPRRARRSSSTSWPGPRRGTAVRRCGRRPRGPRVCPREHRRERRQARRRRPRRDTRLRHRNRRREDDSDLKEKLDGAIAAMKEDGSLNALIRKWFDEDADTF